MLFARENQSVKQYLGDLGGIHDILWVFGLLAVTKVVDHLWIVALIGRIYQLQRYTLDSEKWLEQSENTKLENESFEKEKTISHLKTDRK